MTAPLSITVADLKGIETPLILDVREDWERDIARVNDTIDIPLQALPTRTEELPKDRQIVVMCHHGGRSQRATQWLRQNGYQATNLEGGIDAYAAEIDPAIARY